LRASHAHAIGGAAEPRAWSGEPKRSLAASRFGNGCSRWQKRLRYFLPANPTVQDLALHIFLLAVEQRTRAACRATHDDPAPQASRHAYAGDGAEI